MKIANEILSVLSAGTTNANAYFLPSGQLDRATYTKVNKVLEAAGGKWNRSAKAHVFNEDAGDRIDQVIMTGEVDVPKDEFEFFPTPSRIVDQMLKAADLFDGCTVLEPSAGRGAIAFAAANCGATVDAIELMEANFNHLRVTGNLQNITRADFMDVEPVAKYDRVLMNPPFSKRQDVKHVNHARKFLKPGGKLVAIMSAGVEFRQDKLTQEFRGSVTSIEKLPEGSFKESGTMVNTVYVVITN